MEEPIYDVQTQIDALAAYQACGVCHPLTCGTDSNHALLIGKERDGKVIMICPDCGYIQKMYMGIVEPYVNGDLKESMESWAALPGRAAAMSREWIDRIKWFQPKPQTNE